MNRYQNEGSWKRVVRSLPRLRPREKSNVVSGIRRSSRQRMGCLPLYNWRASFPGAGAEAAFPNAARENMTSPITRIHLERPSIPTLLRRPPLFPPRFWKPALHRSVVKIPLPRGEPAFVGRKRKERVRSFRFEGRVYFTKMVNYRVPN